METQTDSQTSIIGPNSITLGQKWGWYLFDFANSIIIINGGLYFPQWLVIDNRVSGTLFNLTALVTSILLILTAPLFGAKADQSGKCFRYLWTTSLGLFLCGLALALFATSIHQGTVRNVLCLVGFGGVLYTYQLSLVFYNALLNPLSSSGSISKTSGIGLAWGWIGGVVAVIAVDPMVKGQFIFHHADRINAILPSTIAFGALTAISLFLMRKLERLEATQPATRSLSLVGLIRDVKSYPVLFSFLLAYFLYSDAILTIENNVTIFMEKVFSMTDDAKAIAFVAFLLLAAIAAGIQWRLLNAERSLRSLQRCMVGWLIALPVACIVPSRFAWGFYISFLVMGILYGVLFNASRVLFFQLIPKEKIAEYFGIYASFERFASIIGPLLWSMPLILRKEEDALSYRFALGMMIVPILLSMWLLHRARRSLTRLN